MQKVFFRPICHLSNEQAQQIFEELKPVHFGSSSSNTRSELNHPNNPRARPSPERRRQNRFMTELQPSSIPKLPLNPNQQSEHSIFSSFQEFDQGQGQAEKLKEENSRLYYEKMALESSVQRLREENQNKDRQITRLKDIIDSQSTASQQNRKIVTGPVISHQPQTQQVHFISTFEPSNRPF